MKTTQKIKIFAAGIILTYLVQHALILLFPNYFLTIGGNHIRHLTVGAFFLAIIALLNILGRTSKLTIFASGICTSFIIDELVFLALTDGSRAAYFTAFAWISSIVLHLATLAILVFIARRKSS